MNKIIMGFLVLIMAGCTSNGKQGSEAGNAVKLSLNEMSGKLECENLTERMSFIRMDDSCQNALFKGINKCVIDKERIYILDYFGTTSLTVFNSTGKFLFKVGNQGNGSGEYYKITDFDVADNKIFLLDSQSRRILAYDKDARFIKDYPYDGKIDGVNSLIVTSEGNFLLGMDVEMNTSDQVVLTDVDFNVKKILLPFDEHTTRKHLNIGSFRRCGDKIVYYYPVSDNIYIFDNSGQITDRYDVSIGNPIPDDIKSDYEILSREKRNGRKFSYFHETPFLNQRELVATVFSNSNKAMLCLDMDDSSFALKEYKKEDISFSLSDFNFPVYMDDEKVVCNLDGMVYEFMDSNSKEKIDEETKDFLSEGGNVLVVYHLKK